MASNGIDPWMLRNLCRVTARVLALYKSWWLGKVSHDWKKGHFNSIISLCDIFFQGTLLWPGSGRAFFIDLFKEKKLMGWNPSDQTPIRIWTSMKLWIFGRLRVLPALCFTTELCEQQVCTLYRELDNEFFSFFRKNMVWKVSKLHKVGRSICHSLIPFVILMKFPPES